MKENLYQWVKNLAVFYIVFTAILHLIPDSKYERFVRAFMGLLLIFILSAPMFLLLGKGAELAETFSSFYQKETDFLHIQETDNLQQLYLEKGYAEELKQRIKECLKKTDIKFEDVSVDIKGEQVSVILYILEMLTEEQERGILDALWAECRIGEEHIRIQDQRTDQETMDYRSAVRNSSGSGSLAGIQ